MSQMAPYLTALMLVTSSISMAITCPVHLLLSIRQAEDLQSVLPFLETDSGDGFQISGNAAARILGGNLRPVAFPEEWQQSVQDFRSLQGLLGSMVEIEFSELYFGPFSRPDFRHMISGENSSSSLAIFGIGESYFDGAAVERLKSEASLQATPRLVVAQLESILKRPIQENATKIVVLPNLADVIPHGIRPLVSQVLPRPQNQDRYDVTLLGDVVDEGTASWSVELIKDLMDQEQAKRVVVHVPMEACLEQPDRDGGQYSLEAAWERKKEEALRKWTSFALPMGPRFQTIPQTSAEHDGPSIVMENRETRSRIEIRFYKSAQPLQ